MRTIPVWIVLALAPAAACGRSPEPLHGSFEDLFEPVMRVVLEEPDSAPLTGIRSFSPAPDGRFLVVDRGRPQVRVFGPDGELLRIIGRFGSGPGEFRRPRDARIDDSNHLLVADAHNALLTRFDPGMDYDTAFALPGMTVYELGFAAGRLFSILWNEPVEPDAGHNFLAAIVSSDGALVAGFHPVDSLIWQVPYWTSVALPVGASGEDRIAIGNRLFYPLHLYDANGRHLKDFGTPPPSWRQPTRPERGAFIGPEGFTKLEKWLRDMTIISRIGVYRDSAIVVVHAVPQPSVTSLGAKMDTLLDIYAMDGAKIAEDIPVPGRVLRIEDRMYILEATPPEPWTVGVFRLRASVGPR
jgi:hypothetical protein